MHCTQKHCTQKLCCSLWSQVCREQQPERMEPFVFGQSATPGASSSGGCGAADKLDSKKTYAASLLKSGLRTEAVRSEAEPMARGEPKFPCRPTNTS